VLLPFLYLMVVKWGSISEVWTGCWMSYEEQVIEGKWPMYMHPDTTVPPILKSLKVQSGGCRVIRYATGFW
jgi:hypothetical protein